MRLAGRVVALALVVGLGMVVAVPVVALHRTVGGVVLGAAATLAAMRAVRWWVPGGASALAAGWLLTLVAAAVGRPEGDVVVPADSWGWLLLGLAVVVLVTGLAWVGKPTPRHDSGSRGLST